MLDALLAVVDRSTFSVKGGMYLDDQVDMLLQDNSKLDNINAARNLLEYA